MSGECVEVIENEGLVSELEREALGGQEGVTLCVKGVLYYIYMIIKEIYRIMTTD